MTPKEKAKELVDRFDEFTTHHTWRDKNNNAIECALIAVDEILKVLHTNIEDRYWQQVKQEISQL